MRVVIRKKLSTVIFIFWIFFVCANHIHTGNANLHLPVAIAGGLIFAWSIIKNYSVCKKLLKPVVLFAIFALIAVSLVRNVAFYYWGFILGHIGVSLGLALTREENAINYKRWVVFMVLFYFAFYISNKTFDTMYNLASENMVSIYLLLAFYLYYRSKNKTKFATVFLATTSLILGYLSGSRTGLGCLLILCVGLIFIYFLKMRNGNAFLFLVVLTGVIGALTIVFWGTSIIREVLYDSPRIYIWNLYTTQLNSLKNILLGVPFSTHQAFASYYNNLHNIFMNIHARFGLIPLITIVYIIYQCIKNGIKEKQWYIVLFTVLYVLRSLTDNTSFSGPLDILIFTIYFDTILEKQRFYYGGV